MPAQPVKLLFIFGQCIQQHIVSKYVQFIATAAHFHVSIESFAGIVRAQEGLKQTLVSVAGHVEVPSVDQPHSGFQIITVAEQANEEIYGGDVAADVRAVHFR